MYSLKIKWQNDPAILFIQIFYIILFLTNLAVLYIPDSWTIYTYFVRIFTGFISEIIPQVGSIMALSDKKVIDSVIPFMYAIAWTSLLVSIPVGIYFANKRNKETLMLKKNKSVKFVVCYAAIMALLILKFIDWPSVEYSVIGNRRWGYIFYRWPLTAALMSAAIGYIAALLNIMASLYISRNLKTNK